MRVRDWLGISKRRQKQLSYAMELGLVGIIFAGIWGGSTTVVVNAFVGVVATQIPPILERDYDIPMDPALTLWITSAVFLHAFGVLGLPGAEQNLYGQLPWFDHVTHALSASVVAAVGYSTARALDEHSPDIHLPRQFMFVYILLFVLAFGVIWEVIEFGLGELARWQGNTALLTQHGLEDTMLDMVFDTVGALVVATWGTVHLNDIAGYIADQLEARTPE
ncbi:hypothetical protein [Salinibaculum rarum]|jgi:hypothetical protein|uniref:hypothetical protein n=1 Tax=Salinibaculum rarum TaxID=3058903 RepID=UPI0026605058|nr:hypothetical protein [Salinibaculum sp. KK48]